MKIEKFREKNKVAITPHGKGIIKEKEQYRTTIRFGIELENNPFQNISLPFYFKQDITIHPKE